MEGDGRGIGGENDTMSGLWMSRLCRKEKTSIGRITDGALTRQNITTNVSEKSSVEMMLAG